MLLSRNACLTYKNLLSFGYSTSLDTTAKQTAGPCEGKKRERHTQAKGLNSRRLSRFP